MSIKEISETNYYYEKDGSVSSSLKEELIEYYYDSEEEKNIHKQKMKNEGFRDNGPVKKNIGSMSNPEYIWYGRYWRCVKTADMKGE